MTLESICILRLSAIGDACNAVAAVQAIQRHQPNIQVTWIIGKTEHTLLAGLPGVEFIVFEKSQGNAAFTDLKRSLKGRRFDALLHMQVSMRANRVARIISAKRKIGFDWNRSKELHSVVINERIPAQDSPHVLNGFFAFAEKIGVPTSAINEVNWEIPIPPADQAFADRHINPESKVLVICPAASKTERNWLPERYAAVADHAHRRGFQVVLCGGPGPVDKRLGEEIEHHAQYSVSNLIGQTNLKQMLGLLGNARLLLSPDTGPGHMANAQGTPVLGLYAHSNPQRTGPYRFKDEVVEVYHDYLIKQHGKPLSQLHWDTRVKGHDPMFDITVKMVKERFDELLDKYALNA